MQRAVAAGFQLFEHLALACLLSKVAAARQRSVLGILKLLGQVVDEYKVLLTLVSVGYIHHDKQHYNQYQPYLLAYDVGAQNVAAEYFAQRDAETQNKLLYAVTGQTAAEIIRNRADENKPNMGLTVWKGNIVRKGDIVIAKNYLDNDEIDKLNRLVTIFLESAEMRVKERKDLTLDYWRKNVDAMLSFQGMELLIGKGSVSHPDMEKYVKSVYERFDKKRKAYQAQLADEEDNKLLDDLQNMIDNVK